MTVRLGGDFKVTQVTHNQWEIHFPQTEILTTGLQSPQTIWMWKATLKNQTQPPVLVE